MSLIRFEDATFRKFQYTVFPDTTWEMNEGENWAIAGANGSGKTTFLEVLEGRLVRIKGDTTYFLSAANGVINPEPHRLIASVYFNDHSINYGDFYYQQRYHATETDGIITVREYLGWNTDETLLELEALDIRRLLDMEIIKLSNGQFKKMLIAKALLKKPRLLLLDNLYTGLDTKARDYISETLRQVTHMGTQVIMVTGDNEMPDIITHVMEIERFTAKQLSTRENYIARRSVPGQIPPLPHLPATPVKTFEIAVMLDQVTIAYGDTTVLDHAEWTIRRGEKWALTGPNGAGKSMLLSLIFADNPQAYAHKITLFDRRRGTGESIWDIKDHVGFVSPEMHVYFRQDRTCGETALSGLQENPYRKTVITRDIVIIMEELFDYFSIPHLTDTLFQRVSTGQQNRVLLIRALLKNPPMLVLDEPFQGMDAHAIESAKHLLDTYCRERTLIFVSHQPDEIPACVNKHLKIEQGKILPSYRQ
jgi:molybdate transport system ATP-binding protein